jgi:kinesin family member 5
MESRLSVYVRVRPLIKEDIALQKKVSLPENSPNTCTRCLDDNKRILLTKPYYDDREFVVDRVLSSEITQEESYELVGQNIVNEVIQGYNGTIMAYGQTGSGKTFTVFGSRSAIESYGIENHPESGIVPRSLHHIFEYITENIDEAQFQVTVSFMQIYMEVLTDLLIKTKQPKSTLQIREDPKTGIFINGLEQVSVQNEFEVMRIISEAAKARSTSSTSMNKNSSRSHAILQVVLEQRWIEEGPPKKRRIKKGLLTIVDLAGSERLSKSGSEGLRLSEAKTINKSISALGNCIAALAEGNNISHVPFRDSKLTRLLTDSLGGNSKTCMYACIGPALLNYDETYSTLLFATRAMNVRTHVKLNENIDYKVTGSSEGIIQRNLLLETHNNALKQELEEIRNKIQFSPSPILGDNSYTANSYLNEECKCEERNKELVSKFTHMIQYLQGEIARLNVVIANLQTENPNGIIQKLMGAPELKGKIEKYLN